MTLYQRSRFRQEGAIEKRIFDTSLQVRKLLQPTPGATSGKGIKLPKLEVPTFDGNILNWQSFWEMFCVSIHNRPELSDSEKLIYLQTAVKDGQAKRSIEGLSRSGAHYSEAIESLRSQYDRPRLIHQTHVKRVVDAAPLKDGTGKELIVRHGATTSSRLEGYGL